MKCLVYDGPRQLRIEEMESPALQPDQVRIRTLYTGISHGSEMNVYRGIAPFFSRKNDPEVRLFRSAKNEEAWQYPIRSNDPGVWYMGYSSVGEVVEVGVNAEKIKPGDIVYSNAPHQSEAVRSWRQVVKLPSELKPECGIFFTNLMTAYNGILDTRIKLGDTVVVSGLGVLGQMAVQMAKMSGAYQVIGVDVMEKRLLTARENGADFVFNATTGDDIGYEIRKLTNNRGADAVIEVSGSQRALQQAIRMAAPDCTVTALGWYQGACTDLNLAEEFHHNRITIRSSQSVYSDPAIRHMWDHQRKENTCLALLSKLKLENLITHRIPYERVAEAYRMIDNHNDDIIQVVMTY